jgi:DNA modification methylase
MKPVELVERCLSNSTRPGAIVLDPFAGSGSTIIAAERLGRACFGADIDPRYVQVAVERWQVFTGKAATRVHD